MLCRKTQRLTSIGGLTSRTTTPTLGVLDVLNQRDAKSYESLPTISIGNNPWQLPFVLPHLDLFEVTLDLGKSRIIYSLEYDSASKTSTGSTIGSLPDQQSLSTSGGSCPIDSPMPLPQSEYYGRDPIIRVKKKISIDCDTFPELYAEFLTGGDSQSVLLGYPTNFTGKYLETFFMTYIIGDSIPRDVPEINFCYKNIPLCMTSAQQEQGINTDITSGPYSMSGYPSARYPVALQGVTITQDRVKYNITIDGKPYSYTDSRTDDDIPLTSNKIKPLHFPVVHPEMLEDLDRLTEVVQRIGSSQPSGSTLVESPHINEPGGKESEGGGICGFNPDISVDDIIKVLSINYSFFSEKLLDILFVRLWLAIEFILFFFWNIFPLCKEWDYVEDMVLRIFSIDPFKGGGDCVPKPLKTLLKLVIKVYKVSTCCSIAGFLTQPLLKLIPCAIYHIVCFLRKLRYLLVYLFLMVMAFLYYILIHGIEAICNIIANLGSPPNNPPKDANQGDKQGIDIALKKKDATPVATNENNGLSPSATKPKSDG